MLNDQIVRRYRTGTSEVVKTSERHQPLVIGNWSFIDHWSLVIGHSQGHSHDHSRRRAFTLIELILVMALLSIVLAVSAPALSSFFRGRNIDAEGRRVVSLIRYGQSRAVSEGVPVLLWINARQGTYGVEQEPGFTE